MSVKLVLGSIESAQTVNWKNALLVLGHACVEQFAAFEKRQDIEVEALKAMILRLEERTNERIIEMGRLYDRELEVLANALEVSLLTAAHVGNGEN